MLSRPPSEAGAPGTPNSNASREEHIGHPNRRANGQEGRLDSFEVRPSDFVSLNIQRAVCERKRFAIRELCPFGKGHLRAAGVCSVVYKSEAVSAASSHRHQIDGQFVS